jgi:hypothetical protein
LTEDEDRDTAVCRPIERSELWATLAVQLNGSFMQRVAYKVSLSARFSRIRLEPRSVSRKLPSPS